MKNLNLALIRLIQFVVGALFTFIVVAYIGVLILLPLDIVVLASQFLSMFGIGTLFGAIVAIPGVFYLGKIVYNTPGLVQMLVDNGIDLFNMGKQRVDAFNKLAEAAR